MDTQITPLQLRFAIHDVLKSKEDHLNEFRKVYEERLEEFYGMLSRKRTLGTAFPDVDEDEKSAEEGWPQFEVWKEDYRLRAGPSNIANIHLPSLPMLSPPVTATVFPDEIQTELATAGPSTKQPKGTKPSSPPPATTSGNAVSPGRTWIPPPASPAGPSRLSDPAFISLDQIAPPRIRRQHSRFSPPLPPSPSTWIPMDNYNPTQNPSKIPPSLPMPLEWAEVSSLPRLPPIPPVLPKKHRRVKPEKVDLHKLQVTYSLNPISGALAKSSKCVMTRDWKVAQTEMRHIRAMEKIESKKRDGRWSLRQPKKPKGPGVPKAHWDYMLDEMEWMSIDFTEERRWKKLLAREFAYQVVEWHLASVKGRRRLMVGGRGWGECMGVLVPGHSGRVKVENEGEEGTVDMPALEDGEGLNPIGHYSAAVLTDIEAAQERSHEMEVDDDLARKVAKDGEIQPGVEAAGEGEVDADGEADAEGEAETVDGEVSDGVVGLADIPPGDRVDSPLHTATGRSGSGSGSPDMRHHHVLPNGLAIHPQFANAEELIIARKPILDLAFSIPTIDISSMTLQVRNTDSPMPLEEQEESKVALIDLFPDLAVYSGPAPPEQGKVAKRLNEGGGSGSRSTHTSRIMDIRPIFVSSLQPAKNTFNGSWDLHDGPWYEDPSGSADISPEVVASTSSVFTGRGLVHLGAKPTTPAPIPQRQSLRHQHVWTDNEDRILHKLVQSYPFNWSLIADSFASELVGIPTDKPNAYECYDRWIWKWGEGKGKPRPEALQLTQTPGAGPSTSAPSTVITANTPSVLSARPVQTPGTGISVPTLPTQSGSDGPPPPGLSKREAKAAARVKYEGTKTAIRHQCLFDAVRKMHRRRDIPKKGILQDEPQRIIMVHESHMGYMNTQIATPFELVEAKYVRDMRDRQLKLREAQAQQAQGQARQQAILAANQNRAGGPPPGAQALQQQIPGQIPQHAVPLGQPQPPPGTAMRMGPNGLPMAPSQQQLLTAVAAASAARQNAQGNGQPIANPSNRVSVNVTGPQPNAIPNQPTQQQMQMMQAHQMAARANQAAAQQTRVPAGGTPLSQPGTLSASPYAQSMVDLPIGEGIHHSSPAMGAPHSSPSGSANGLTMGRVPSMPLAGASHLRVPSGGGNSPQMTNPIPMSIHQNQLMSQSPILHNQPPPHQQSFSSQGTGPTPGSAMSHVMAQQMMATFAANGQQPTPENVRAYQMQLMRQVQAGMPAQNQGQGVGQAQGQQSMGTPLMAHQGVQQFARSPNMQNPQAGGRASPKPPPPA